MPVYVQSEKKRKQEEAALKAKQAAEDAQRMLDMIKAKEGSVAPSETPNPCPPESAAATPAPEDGMSSKFPTPAATDYSERERQC